LSVDITAVGNTKNIELVKSLGADRVIDYEEEDFTQKPDRYDYIFDAVGKSSFAKCKPLLKPGGIYMSSEVGYLAQNIFYALVSPIMGSRKVKFPFPKDCKKSLLFIKELIELGKFKTVIDRKYPLEKIVDAFKYVETGQKTGNVVITVAHDEK
jgi:NADPH:quinone reductase-like Zn-dependent oxidoreductase